MNNLRSYRSIGLGLAGLLVACGGSSSQGDAGSGSTAADTENGDDGTPTGADGGPGSSGGGPATGDTGNGTADTGPGDGTGTTGGLPDDAEVWELRVDYSQPIPVETYYSCFSFSVEVEQLHHIIGFVPQVTTPLVHHYVLSYSPYPTNHDPNIPCFEWPDQILWAWAPGMPAFELPPEAGFLVGHVDNNPGVPTNTVDFVLQVHYNNPLLQDFDDTGGIDVVVTKSLRDNRAGVFSQGDIGAISIPPGMPAYQHTATCTESETMGLLTEPINVFASFLHAHEIGTAISSEVFRDGGSIGLIAEEDPYDFNFQKFIDTDIQIQPGDRIETSCTYDSSRRVGTTSGGVASNEEMCINFMMYYPWVEAETCGSL